MSVATPNICPYCGSNEPVGAVCLTCGGLLDPASRAATAADIGPWFVRDPARPFFPGCSLVRIKRMVRDQQLRRDSIVRGPTTHGFWIRAARVPGLARLLGTCHACGSMVGTDDLTCARCGVPLSIEHQLSQSLAPPASDAAASAIDLIKRAQYQRIDRLQSFVRLQAIALAVALGGLFVIFVVYLTGLLEEPPPEESTDQLASASTLQVQPGEGDPPETTNSTVAPEEPLGVTTVAPESPGEPPPKPPAAAEGEAADSEAVDATLLKLRDRLHDVSPEQAAVITRLGELLSEAGRPDGSVLERSEAIQRAYRLIDETIPNEEDEFMRLRLRALRGLFVQAQARLDAEAALEE